MALVVCRYHQVMKRQRKKTSDVFCAGLAGISAEIRGGLYADDGTGADHRCSARLNQEKDRRHRLNQGEQRWPEGIRQSLVPVGYDRATSA